MHQPPLTTKIQCCTLQVIRQDMAVSCTPTIPKVENGHLQHQSPTTYRIQNYLLTMTEEHTYTGANRISGPFV